MVRQTAMPAELERTWLAPTTHTVFEGPQSGAISERGLTTCGPTCTSQTQPTKFFNNNGIEYIIISTHFWHNNISITTEARTGVIEDYYSCPGLT